MLKTDHKQFTAMLEAAGIGYQEEEDEEGLIVIVGEYDNWLMANPKGWEGYTGFYAKLHFTREGGLVKIGVWE